MLKVPKYRKHSTRNIGFVEVDRKRHYFPGKYNSPISMTAYADFIKKLVKLRSQSEIDLRVTQGDDVPIAILCARFLDWAKGHYRKNGRSTGTYERFRDCVIPPFLDMYGDMPTSGFGPIALKKLRDKFVATGICRNEVNDRTSRIKRIFNWGVANELVSESVAGSLRYVTALKPGETTARETLPKRPVSDSIIQSTLPFLPPTVDDMVRIQRLTGCRPSEIFNLRWCDIDQTDDIWIYTPFEHKTEHKKKRRHVAMPLAAQAILAKYRHRPVEEFIFSPRETIRLISARRRAGRALQVTKAHDKSTIEEKSKYREKYTIHAYEHAIDRAASKGNVPKWSPNQVRHTFATVTEGCFDKETVQILLGHSHPSTTEIYLDENVEKIKAAARKTQALPKT